MTKPGLFATAAGATLLAMVPFSPHTSPTTAISVSLDTAEARVGRPLTPMSVAGVHRRAYRRGYAGWGPAAGIGLGLGALAAGAAASSYGYNNYPYGGGYYAPGYYGSNAYYGSPTYYGSGAYYGGPGYYAPNYRPAYRWRHFGW